VLVKFRVRGNIRFLSHADTVKVFQRACARAGIEIRHSEGFNPHPILSLPLPRPVGVESDDDLLILQICHEQDELRASSDESRIMARLSEQLPEGLELLSVNIAQTKRTFHPCSATCVITLIKKNHDDLKAKIANLLTGEHLIIKRKTGKKHSQFTAPNSEFKEVDVKPFLKSIELEDDNIIVQCRFSPAGSIRIEEIFKLLELKAEDLAVPVRRTNIQWQENIIRDL